MFDDGVGMSAEDLEALEKITGNDIADSDSIGIRNVHKRLRMVFKDQVDFNINSSNAVGTEINIKIPIALCRLLENN